MARRGKETAPTPARRSYRANDPESRDKASWPSSKAAIYDAAVEVFSRKGFDGASVQDIADEAGLTKGAVYHYFDSKDALLELITELAAQRSVDALREVLDGMSSARDGLRVVIHQLMGDIAAYRREMTLFWDQWRREHSALPDTKRARDEYEAMVVDVIDRGIASGELKPVADTRVLSFALFGMCLHSQYWWRPNDALGPDGISDAFASIFLDGVAAGSAGAGSPGGPDAVDVTRNGRRSARRA